MAAAAGTVSTDKLKIILIAPVTQIFLNVLLKDLKETFTDFDLTIYNEFPGLTLPAGVEGEIILRYITEDDLRPLVGKNVLIIDSSNTFDYSENGTVINFNGTYRDEPGVETFRINTQYVPMWDEVYKKGLYFNLKAGQIQTLFKELYRISEIEDKIFGKFTLMEKIKEIINVVAQTQLGKNTGDPPTIFEKIDRTLLPIGDIRSNFDGLKRELGLESKYYQKYLKYKSKYLTLKSKI